MIFGRIRESLLPQKFPAIQYVLFIFQYSYFDLKIRALNYVSELNDRIEKAKELQTKRGNKDMLNE